LLAEDHPVNQRVASRLLEKIGAAVVIANDGAEAIARVAESRFDALLMDCQMPVMDGWAATERIREIERQSGSGTRLPIIALTANVMNEDRERCIAAGMDDHLGKPIDARLLTECLARHVNSAAMAAEFDADAWRAMIGDDREFERELIATFVLSGDQRMAEIVDALRSNDLDTVKECAHALKGASASIHAHGLTAAASRLEKAARDAPAQEIEVLVQRLAAKLDAVNEQLRNAG
jgi:CheY-like chemotaxis protein